MTDQERGQRAQRRAAAASAMRNVPVLEGYLPLSRLKNVAVKTPDAFLKDLAKLEVMIRDLPIALPAEGEYQLELRGDELHVFERSSGIQGYQLFGSGSVLRRQESTEIKVQTDRGLSQVFLYHEPREDISPAASTRRRTSPYRATQWESAPEYGGGSESRGSAGGGER